MNKILKAFLQTAGKVAQEAATETLPGAGILIGGVTKLVDKNHDNNAEAIGEIESGLVSALSALEPDKVSNPVLLAEALVELQDVVSKVKLALTK